MGATWLWPFSLEPKNWTSWWPVNYHTDFPLTVSPRKSLERSTFVESWKIVQNVFSPLGTNFPFRARSVFLLADMQRKSNHLLSKQIVEIFRNGAVFQEWYCVSGCAMCIYFDQESWPWSRLQPTECKENEMPQQQKKTVFRSREAIIPNASGTGIEAKGMMIIIKNSIVVAAAAIDNVRFFYSCSTEFHPFFVLPIFSLFCFSNCYYYFRFQCGQ